MQSIIVMGFKSIFLKILYGAAIVLLIVLNHWLFGAVNHDFVPDWVWRASEDTFCPVLIFACTAYFLPFGKKRYLNALIAGILAVLGDILYWHYFV